MGERDGLIAGAAEGAIIDGIGIIAVPVLAEVETHLCSHVEAACWIDAPSYRARITVERFGLLTWITPSLCIVEVEVDGSPSARMKSFANRVVLSRRIYFRLDLPGRDTYLGVNHD